MRKKPAGELLASAHRIDREYRIMAALHGVIPVPRMLHLCLDETVIGQAFYLMDHVEGQIAADARLIDIEPGERRALSLNLVEVLAQLHKADFKALDLEDYGRATGYRSEEHTSELQSLLRISYAVFCLTQKNHQSNKH